MSHGPASEVPVIDVAPLVGRVGDQAGVAAAIGRACRKSGFFYVVEHGVGEDVQCRLEDLSHTFFAQDLDEKLEIRMALAGKAWRGYFPLGDELTSGKPDVKEGLYFGSELSTKDPRVQAGVPLHGPKLFPAEIAGFEDTILEYMTALTDLGHALMRGVALSLGLEPAYFRDGYMADPLTLFRIFHYPPVTVKPHAEKQWGVGEHTDYGVLTILRQDDVGGLQVKTEGQWIDALPSPIPLCATSGTCWTVSPAGYTGPTRTGCRTRPVAVDSPFPFSSIRDSTHTSSRSTSAASVFRRTTETSGGTIPVCMSSRVT